MRAIDNFRRCSQEAPNNTTCLRMLGLLMEGTGKRDQAKPIYEQILKIQPDHPVALNNLAFAKAEEGVDLDQALTMAQRAVQMAPNSPELKDTLGWIYIKKNIQRRRHADLQRPGGRTTRQPDFPLSLRDGAAAEGRSRRREEGARDRRSS